MKKLLLTILIAITSCTAFAGTKLIFGSLRPLLEAKEIPVYVDWSKTVYNKTGTLSHFLSRAPRNPNWEEESLKYFFMECNLIVSRNCGIRFIMPKDSVDYEYWIVIRPTTINEDGDIEGIILFNQKGEDVSLAKVFFKSDDSDDDDEIAFKDQFESIGKSFGKLIKSRIKR